MPWTWPLDKGLSGERWVKYHFADGSVQSSHEVYWRALQWEHVVKLELSLRRHVYEVLPGPGHKGFITYRNVAKTWKQVVPTPSNGKKEGFWYERHSWLIGYLDSTHAHMTEVDFHTGELMGHPVEPIKVIESHIHPRLKQKWAFGWDLMIKARREKHAILVQGRL